MTQDVKAFTETEQKCIAINCPYFIVWEYYGKELHSCKLQGESDVVQLPATDVECEIKED